MKVLVLGCNGMAGHMIAIYMKEKGHMVHGFARKDLKFISCITGDAQNSTFLKETIINGNYDIVINCIGILNNFAEQNKATAVYLNSYLPHLLAVITEDTKTKIIHISTDCVFSGDKGGYTENDFPDGKTFYDRSKALGELNDEKNLTIRTSIVGPDINENGIGLLNWFLKQKDSVSGYKKAIWTGQTTLQLAKTIENACSQNIYGLYNMVPSASISKYDLLQLFNQYIKKQKIEIIPNDSYSIDKSLIRTNFNFKYEIPDYLTMVKELAQWMNKHKSLYPHYKL